MMILVPQFFLVDYDDYSWDEDDWEEDDSIDIFEDDLLDTVDFIIDEDEGADEDVRRYN
jgi:hypothetical protein